MTNYVPMAPLAKPYTEDEIEDVDETDAGNGVSSRLRRTRPPTAGVRPTRREMSPLVPPTNGNSQRTEIIDVDLDTRGNNNPATHPGVDDGFFDRGSDTGSKNPGAPFPANPMDWDSNPAMPDVNLYQHKKTLAQGLMDLALVSANANQLRYVLESSNRHPYYYFSLSLIIISIFIQVVVGVGLIMNSRYNIKSDEEMHHANRINNITMVLIFLLTFVNVFITAFGVAEFQPSPAALQDAEVEFVTESI